MKRFILIMLSLAYLSFIALDILDFFIVSNYVKFASISLIFVLVSIENNTRAIMGILLTVFCDYLLLFTENYGLGIGIFSIVHIIYISTQLKKGKTITILSSGLPFLFFPFGIIIQSFFYTTLILTNLFISVKKQNYLLSLAFVLFALCDISVAGYYITNASFLLHLIWIFYLPSQILIALNL